MANSKLTALTELTTPAAGDYGYIVDTSDTTDDAAGSSKKIALENFGGRVLLAEITNASAGEFDFDSIPQTYNRLVIEGHLRSELATISETVHIYFNNDLTDANYYSQRLASQSGSSSSTEQSEPEIAVIAGTTSPANMYGFIQVLLCDYTDTSIVKSYMCDFVGNNDTARLWTGKISGRHDSMTAAITRLRVRTDNHPTDLLFGKLRLYGQI